MTNINCQDEVIDLTNSFTLVNHHVLSNAIIELLDSDESFVKSPVVMKKKNVKSKSIHPKCISQNKNDSEMKEELNNNNSLLCPICWENFGKKPLASTLCGHVFCLACLKNCLKIKKKCPACRTKLKGSISYHPLYI